MISRRRLEAADKGQQKIKKGHGRIEIIPMSLWRRNTPEGETIIT